jgi:hypothetical protein
MSTIKKGYTELYAVLLANEDKKVKTVMSLLMPIMTALQRDKNDYLDEDGRLVVFCYYHKQWEHVDQVPYGKKANTTTGLNTMCKVGTNQWTKQQREYKAAADTILDLVEAGTLAYEDIPAKRAEFAEQKDRIVSLEEHHWIEAHADERQKESPAS